MADQTRQSIEEQRLNELNRARTQKNNNPYAIKKDDYGPTIKEGEQAWLAKEIGKGPDPYAIKADPYATDAESKRLKMEDVEQPSADLHQRENLPLENETAEEETEASYQNELNQARAGKTQIIPMPEKPKVPFPWILFFIALVNDILDVVEEITEAAAVPTTAGTGTVAILVGDNLIDTLWAAIRFFIRAMGKKTRPNANPFIAMLVEWIPGLELFPTFTLEIIITYFSDLSAAKKAHKQAMEKTKLEAASMAMEMSEEYNII